MKVQRECPVCEKIREMEVDPVAYEKWQKGELIQRAFPKLNPNEREFLKTGICPDCWERFRED